MKFLLDEKLSSRQAETVRELGHDAVSVAESGLAGADDSAVRLAAIEGGPGFSSRSTATPPTCSGFRRRLRPASYACVCTRLRKKQSPRLFASQFHGLLACIWTASSSLSMNARFAFVGSIPRTRDQSYLRLSAFIGAKSALPRNLLQRHHAPSLSWICSSISMRWERT